MTNDALPSAVLQARGREATSHREILRSSALIGAASALTLAIGIVRTKAMAMLLGPAGIGLFGLYGTIIEFTRSVASMGISNSGVRQIAEAVGTHDVARIARTVQVLRRTTLVLGIVGATSLAVLSQPVSHLTFGDDQHATAILALSLAVLFRLVADGQAALLQGMRRIPDLARISIIGGLLGAFVSIAVVYFLHQAGVAAALTAVAAMSMVTSWWTCRKIEIGPPILTNAEMREEAASLLKLGAAFMASGLLMLGAAYTVRMIVLHQIGLEATGLYESAWTLGGLYVGFVLQAMGADFYPRLVAAITDREHSNRLVNEQSHVSLLLAGPGVIATLTFASFVVSLFYTEAFRAGLETLRWICLGMALRVITWPIGYIIVAQNRRLLFFGAELAWTVVNIALSWTFIQWFGLEGAGMAFLGSYVFHAALVYTLARRLVGFHWSPNVWRTGVLFVTCISLVFYGFQRLSGAWATSIGGLALIASSIYAVHAMLALVAPASLPRPVQRLLASWMRSRPTP